MSIPFLAPAVFMALRVPAIQFTADAGSPPKLVNTDLIASCGIPQLPASLTSILALVNGGLAYTINAAMTAINADIAGVIGQINTFIGSTTGSLQALYIALASSITTGDVVSLSMAISGVATSIANTAGVLTSMNALATSLGQPALPSLGTIFGGVAAGSLNTAVAGVTSAVSDIVTQIAYAVIHGAASISALLPGLTSAMLSAASASLASVTGIISGLSDTINSAISGLANSLGSASALALGFLCAEMAGFKSFINSIATPALEAALPT